ncbi:uncharacterized protein TNCV_2682471 [Trichonephila clavipes]|nr:uncharacterized protein TNCV_2682471 [Trichonephila clavipes]
MRCIGQGLESLKTFCAVMSLPNPVEQKSYDVINNKLSRVMKEVAEESMKRAAVEENSSSPDNLLTVSGDGTWKTRGHSSWIGVCTVIGAETGKVLDREVLSSFCKGCDSYKGVTFGIKYNKWQRAHKNSCRKNYSGSAGKMEVDGMLRIFNRSEKLHNLKYSNYIGDGDTKTFNALSENKPYGDDHLIQKIECVGHLQKRMGTRLRKLKIVYSKKKLSDGKTIGGKGRLTDSLIDKLAHYYGHNVTVNGDWYRATITIFFIPELNNHDVQELWFQQDGTTCHTARATIDLLKDTFGDRLISRFGPVNWPPKSCDLTPLDFFLWGYVKSLVYVDKPQTLEHLEDNIRHVIANIRSQMLEKVIENWTSRLDYTRASRQSYARNHI